MSSTKTFSVNLSSPSNATIGTAAPPARSMTTTARRPYPSYAGSAVESDGTMTFNVTLSAASGRTVTVSYATSNGTATRREYYASTRARSRSSLGHLTKAISVPIVNDALDEPDTETFTVTLSGPSNATIADGFRHR